MKKYLLIVLFSFLFIPTFACLILFITDGKNILVANHEDWYANDAEITFIPANGKKMGMLYFDFASEGTAQGGMNTAGLFFDGTRTPYAPYPDNNKKEDCHCYTWKRLLEECSTTAQAIAFVEKYKIPEIEDIHILFADRNGNAAIIGVYDGKLQIHRREKKYQLLTNFNITDPSYGGEEPCKRFATAEAMLKTDSSVSVHNLENILSKTHQDALTAYSNIYNLTTGEVYIYRKANFQKKVKVNLVSELKKGKHAILLAKLLA
ncbi:MAG: carcinine hydrolase/isopenicillin-N N-acyltransferase family protein [Bacteroidota bacterium]